MVRGGFGPVRVSKGMEWIYDDDLCMCDQNRDTCVCSVNAMIS